MLRPGEIVMSDKIGRVALVAISCASALIAAACASIAPPMQANLVGTRWAVQTIDTRPVSGARTPTLHFDAQNRVTGSAGCNSYFGTYASGGGDLEISGVGATEMACAAPIMSQETAFLSALDAASRYVVENDNRLVLSGPNGRNLTLVRVG